MGKNFVIGMVVFAHIFMIGCGRDQGSRDQGNTITVTDSFNRQVVVPKDVKRIACLYAFSGHVVTMLGRGNDIVAVVRGLKRDVLLIKICPSIKDAAVPNLNDVLNMEELARVKPDVVFIKDSVAKKKKDTDMLDKLGIPYVVIAYNNIEEQKKAVQIIGRVIGREKEAEEYSRYYQECMDRVRKIVTDMPEEKRAKIYHAILEPLKTDGPGSISAEWMSLAGIVNVSTRDRGIINDVEGFVNIEQVLLWNPDVIIVHEDSTMNTITGSKQWSTISAVKNKKVFRMPNGISRWGHPGSIETPLALLWAVKTIYPDSASSIDLEKETMDFYKRFFRYELSHEMAGDILRGKGMRKPKKE